MIEHNGRLIETFEEIEVRRELLDWWKADCGWGRTTAEMDPNPPQGTNPSVFEPHTEVEPSPSRKRDRPHSNSYGLNSKGRKSHHKPKGDIVDASQQGVQPPGRL